jgi:PQQ-like domain
VNSTDGNIYGLDASSGEVLWTYPVGYSITSPAVADGVVYTAADPGTIYAFHLS